MLNENVLIEIGGSDDFRVHRVDATSHHFSPPLRSLVATGFECIE